MFDLTLTFDFYAWPDPDVTPRVLDSLGRRAGSKPTFFVIGEKLADPETARPCGACAPGKDDWIGGHTTHTHGIPLGEQSGRGTAGNRDRPWPRMRSAISRIRSAGSARSVAAAIWTSGCSASASRSSMLYTATRTAGCSGITFNATGTTPAAGPERAVDQCSRAALDADGAARSADRRGGASGPPFSTAPVPPAPTSVQGFRRRAVPVHQGEIALSIDDYVSSIEASV